MTLDLTHAPDAGCDQRNTGNEIHSNLQKKPDEDGKSVSYNMRALSIQPQPGKNASGNKRAAPEPTQGQIREDRPSKLRSPSMDDYNGHGLSQNPGRTGLYSDPAHDQRPSAPHPPVSQSPNHEAPPETWPSNPGAQTRGGILLREKSPAAFQSSLAKRGSPSVNLEASPPSSPLFNTDKESTMLLQPETRPISQDQLVNEVKGIYAGLVMVEKKCVEIDQQQSSTTNKLSDEQWQALIALHRTLLHEHHDFFLASQHPSSSPALQRLATKYAMPARMGRRGTGSGSAGQQPAHLPAGDERHRVLYGHADDERRHRGRHQAGHQQHQQMVRVAAPRRHEQAERVDRQHADDPERQRQPAAFEDFREGQSIQLLLQAGERSSRAARLLCRLRRGFRSVRPGGRLGGRVQVPFLPFVPEGGGVPAMRRSGRGRPSDASPWPAGVPRPWPCRAL